MSGVGARDARARVYQMMVLFWVEVGKSFCTKELVLLWLHRRLKTSGPSAVANVGTPFNQQHDNVSDYQRRHTLKLQNACVRILGPRIIEITYTMSSILTHTFGIHASVCVSSHKKDVVHGLQRNPYTHRHHTVRLQAFRWRPMKISRQSSYVDRQESL